jgi:hypothetical protein
MYSQAVDGDAPSSHLDDPYLWFMERVSQYSKTVENGLLFLINFFTQRALAVQIIGPFERVLCYVGKMTLAWHGFFKRK